MPTITATAGASNANSYVTLEQANTYFDERFNSLVWLDAEEPDQQRALIQACRQLSRLMFIGQPVDSAQALPFPRTYDWGSRLASMPQVIKDAQCEEALALLVALGNPNDEPDRAELQQMGVKSYSVGSLSETFSDAAVGTGYVVLKSQEARDLLRGWIRQTADLEYPGRLSSWIVNVSDQ